MISVLMPYWERADNLFLTLESFCVHYAGRFNDFEVVIVDDGSVQQPASSVTVNHWPFKVELVELPKKHEPKNPCVPFNIARAHARAEALVLTNPECRHDVPCLFGMLQDLTLTAHPAYIVAACRHPDGYWLQNSAAGPSANLNYLTMLTAAFFDELGGFCEEFREGFTGEDNDFRDRIVQAGATIRHRDDLICTHLVGRFDVDATGPKRDRNQEIWLRRRVERSQQPPRS